MYDADFQDEGIVWIMNMKTVMKVKQLFILTVQYF